MTDDIVTRLRLWVTCYTAGVDIGHDLAEAADEIERLRSEMRRIMEERDEARREVCRIDAETYGSVVLVSERRGWDCYKEDTDDR